MKAYLIIGFVAVAGIIASCKKGQLPYPVHGPNPGTTNNVARKVRYELYTDVNFAGQTKNIQFNLLMRNDKTHKELIDSALAVMRLDQIPDFNHRIIIEKDVPKNVAADAVLTVGFTYYLQNVGYSWYLDTVAAGNVQKVVRVAYR